MSATKKILFDLTAVQPNISGKRHGGGKYGEIVFRRMVELGIRPVCFYRSSLWLNPDVVQIINQYELQLIDVDSIELEDIIKKEYIDILYSCLPSMEILQLKSIKVKGTLHGLRYLETPYDPIFWYYRGINMRIRMRYVVEKCLQIVGIHYRRHEEIYKVFCENPNVDFTMVSHHSASSLLCYYPQYKGLEIPVFYSPSTSLQKPISERVYKDKYFLMVSGNRWDKNNLRAIKALDRLFSTGFLEGYKAKVTGAESAQIYRYKLQNPERFDFLGYVSESQLEQLYHDAFSFIYPSLNEGFGYPPLEAMRYGVPVLASPYSSIPEVCQGAVLYFNPTSVEEIMNRILLISTNPELYSKLQQLSYSQYEQITSKQKKDLDGLIEWVMK